MLWVVVGLVVIVTVGSWWLIIWLIIRVVRLIHARRLEAAENPGEGQFQEAPYPDTMDLNTTDMESSIQPFEMRQPLIYVFVVAPFGLIFLVLLILFAIMLVRFPPAPSNSGTVAVVCLIVFLSGTIFCNAATVNLLRWRVRINPQGIEFQPGFGVEKTLAWADVTRTWIDTTTGRYGNPGTGFVDAQGAKFVWIPAICKNYRSLAGAMALAIPRGYGSHYIPAPPSRPYPWFVIAIILICGVAMTGVGVDGIKNNVVFSHRPQTWATVHSIATEQNPDLTTGCDYGSPTIQFEANGQHWTVTVDSNGIDRNGWQYCVGTRELIAYDPADPTNVMIESRNSSYGVGILEMLIGLAFVALGMWSLKPRTSQSPGFFMHNR